jgi:hypothetical protein
MSFVHFNSINRIAKKSRCDRPFCHNSVLGAELRLMGGLGQHHFMMGYDAQTRPDGTSPFHLSTYIYRNYRRKEIFRGIAIKMRNGTKTKSASAIHPPSIFRLLSFSRIIPKDARSPSNSSCMQLAFRVSSAPSHHQIGVSAQELPHRKELSGRTRLLCVLLGVGLSALLGIATVLQPDPHHHGTHQQLGLPPCTFYYLFGVPCPTCGMTTSWAHLMRGEILTSFRVNAGGAILGMLAILAVPWSLATAIRGRPIARLPRERLTGWFGVGILAVVLLQWGCRLIEHLHR